MSEIMSQTADKEKNTSATEVTVHTKQGDLLEG